MTGPTGQAFLLHTYIKTSCINNWTDQGAINELLVDLSMSNIINVFACDIYISMKGL
jgi:hypothetical protein